MTDTTAGQAPSAPRRMKGAFDDDVYGKNLDVGQVSRLMHWMRPYRGQAIGSLVLVLLAAVASIMAPTVMSRVLVDGIVLKHQGPELADLGQQAFNQWIAATLSVTPLIAACIQYMIWILLAAALGRGFGILFGRATLNTLRDLRCDLFEHLEHLPSSFYDRVAVGRVMTRVANDVETLFELFAGFGQLAGQFVPFFVAITIMLTLSPTLTFELLPVMPVAALFTWMFRRMSRPLYRAIRMTISRLNENLQENLSGIEVVQLYVRDCVSSVTRPVKELKAFQKISLRPGETRTVALDITPDALAFYDIHMKYVVEPGEFEILVGNSSRDADLQKVMLTVVP